MPAVKTSVILKMANAIRANLLMASLAMTATCALWTNVSVVNVSPNKSLVRSLKPSAECPYARPVTDHVSKKTHPMAQIVTLVTTALSVLAVRMENAKADRVIAPR